VCTFTLQNEAFVSKMCNILVRFLEDAPLYHLLRTPLSMDDRKILFAMYITRYQGNIYECCPYLSSTMMLPR